MKCIWLFLYYSNYIHIHVLPTTVRVCVCTVHSSIHKRHVFFSAYDYDDNKNYYNIYSVTFSFCLFLTSFKKFLIHCNEHHHHHTYVLGERRKSKKNEDKNFWGQVKQESLHLFFASSLYQFAFKDCFSFIIRFLKFIHILDEWKIIDTKIYTRCQKKNILQFRYSWMNFSSEFEFEDLWLMTFSA